MATYFAGSPLASHTVPSSREMRMLSEYPLNPYHDPILGVLSLMQFASALMSPFLQRSVRGLRGRPTGVSTSWNLNSVHLACAAWSEVPSMIGSNISTSNSAVMGRQEANRSTASLTSCCSLGVLSVVRLAAGCIRNDVAMISPYSTGFGNITTSLEWQATKRLINVDHRNRSWPDQQCFPATRAEGVIHE